MTRSELFEKIRSAEGDLSRETLLEQAAAHRALLGFYQRSGETENATEFRQRLIWIMETLTA